MLQGILQGAGPVGSYYKVLTGRVVEREFRARWLSFQVFRSWILLVLGVLVPGVLIPGVLVLGVLVLDDTGIESPRWSRESSAV